MNGWLNIQKKTNFFLLLVVMVQYMQPSYAQTCGNDSSTNKKAQNYFREAIKASNEEKKTDLALYKKALAIDTSLTAAWYILGEIYHKKAIQSQYDILLHQHAGFYFKKAEECFNHVLYQCAEYKDYACYYYLGENYYLQKEYSLAGYYLKIFLDDSKKRWPVNNQAELYYKNYLQWKNWQSNPYTVNQVPLSGVATENDELLPFIDHSGTHIYYKRRMEKPQKNTLYKTVIEEYYQSEIAGVDSNDNLQYHEGNLLDWPFDMDAEIKEIAIANSNMQLYATHLIKTKIQNQYQYDCDIYAMYNNGDFWEDEEKMPYPINDTAWDGHVSLSADGNCMYFSSNRSGGFGGKDIYCSVKDSLQNWSKPVNLGSEINTINDEINPFIHYDGKTLYFSSDGIFGMGGFDIFRSQKTDKNHWSYPQNMGKPINSASDDLGLVLDARGNKGYLASNRLAGIGGWDIFSMDIPSVLRPEAYQIIGGKILEKNEMPVQDLSLTLVSVKNNNLWHPRYNAHDGSFYCILPKADDSYLLQIHSNDYNYANQLVRFKNNNSYVYRAITLDKIKIGQTYLLEKLWVKPVLNITTESLFLLTDFAGYLCKNPELKVEFLISPCSKKSDENTNAGCKKLANQLMEIMTSNNVARNQIQITIDYKLNKDSENIPVFIKVLEK